MSKRVVYRRASHAADLDKMRLDDELCDVTIKVSIVNQTSGYLLNLLSELNVM